MSLALIARKHDVLLHVRCIQPPCVWQRIRRCSRPKKGETERPALRAVAETSFPKQCESASRRDGKLSTGYGIKSVKWFEKAGRRRRDSTTAGKTKQECWLRRGDEEGWCSSSPKVLPQPRASTSISQISNRPFT